MSLRRREALPRADRDVVAALSDLLQAVVAANVAVVIDDGGPRDGGIVDAHRLAFGASSEENDGGNEPGREDEQLLHATTQCKARAELIYPGGRRCDCRPMNSAPSVPRLRRGAGLGAAEAVLAEEHS